MLYSKVTPEQKRVKLRELLASGTVHQFPGAFNPLSARLIEEKGFAGVYISGAVLANDLGLPGHRTDHPHRGGHPGRADRPHDGPALPGGRGHRLR